LAETGVFETSESPTYAWAAPKTGQTFFLRALAVLVVVLLGAGREHDS